MVSIKAGSALMLYGGKLGSTAISQIWKYSVDQDSWTKVGDLIKPRIEHASYAVTGLECP